MIVFAEAVSMGYREGEEMNKRHGSGNSGYILLFQKTWQGRKD